MDVKSFAKPYQWQGATLWLMPYRTPHVDIVTRALNDLEPEIEYVNTATGERSLEEPSELAEKRAKAAKIKSQLPIQTAWVHRRNWGIFHDTFALAMPLLVAVDFPEVLSAELQAFATYWCAPGSSVAERWRNFQMVIGSATMEALWEAVKATHDNPAPAKPALSEVTPKDPKEDENNSGNAIPTTASSVS